MTARAVDRSRSPLAERDRLGTVAVGAAGVSLLGFVVLVVGHLLAPGTFNNTKHAGAADYAAFYAFVLGLLVALFLGGTVWVYGRRHGRGGRRSPAALATGYGVLALVVAVVIAALGG